MRYISKVYLKFKLPDGSTKEGFFRQSQGLRGIIGSFGVKGKAFLVISLEVGGRARLGKTTLDLSKNIGQLGLKNDDVIRVK
ncbi:unnamed protein product [marine sediment metagenome]|uniref:Uncharacterized protein n=1 Tax=marine sediment metagenome TaxID=412755 RepID=X1VIG0_9ZZZZ